MSRAFTLTQIRYFTVVAQRLSMTAAAKELNVSQSTLSAAMHQLERELRTDLFVRVPRRGLALTPAGRRLFAESHAFLEHADRLPTLVSGDAPALTGELTVGMFSPLAAFRAPVVLQAFEARHPQVRVTFVEGDQETLRRALEGGRCEAALMYDLGLGPEIPCRTVERIPPHAVVAEDHPLAAAGETSLRALAEEPYILLDLPHSREYFLSLFRIAGIAPRIRHRTAGYETVRSFVSRGHGYSLLNQRIGHDLTYAGGQVVPLRLTDELPPIEVRVVFPPGARPTRRALAFADVCAALYSDDAAA